MIRCLRTTARFNYSSEIPQVEEWTDLERLNKERDLIGIYLSAHPLDDYACILNYVCTADTVN